MTCVASIGPHALRTQATEPKEPAGIRRADSMRPLSGPRRVSGQAFAAETPTS